VVAGGGDGRRGADSNGPGDGGAGEPSRCFTIFQGEAAVGADCLVQSTDFFYSDENPAGAADANCTFLAQ